MLRLSERLLLGITRVGEHLQLNTDLSYHWLVAHHSSVDPAVWS